MTPLAIAVLINGSFVPSSPPAGLLFGHVVAPLAPVVAHLVERAAVTGDVVTLTLGDRTCTFRIGTPAFRCDGTPARAALAPFARGGVVFLPLADVVRAFGGHLAYDARSGSAAVTFGRPSVVETPVPFDSAAPRATPAVIFTPQPAPPTPQVPVPGDPRPRRTAIPDIPSRSPG